MAAFQFDETIIRGDDHPLELIFYDEDDAGVLTPTNISLFTWQYTVKTSPAAADADALIVLDTAGMTLDADPDLTRNPTAVVNRLTFWLPHADTADMTAGNYYHDLQSVEIASGHVQTRGIGTLVVADQVTVRTAPL